MQTIRLTESFTSGVSMHKKICAYIFGITFITFTSIVFSQSTTISRGPSVDPLVEIDIEDVKRADGLDASYNFTNTEKTETKSRVPANIVTNEQATGPASFIGPIIFLIALPIGLWMMISRRFNKAEEEKKVDYYSKTTQFKPFKTEYQKTAEDDEDIDYPKAS